jgi:hypothetical protein
MPNSDWQSELAVIAKGRSQGDKSLSGSLEWDEEKWMPAFRPIPL